MQLRKAEAVLRVELVGGGTEHLEKHTALCGTQNGVLERRFMNTVIGREACDGRY